MQHTLTCTCRINIASLHLYFLTCNLQSALGYDYQAQLAKHGSQTDAAKGFGGKYGVQKERKDKVSAHVHNVQLYVQCTLLGCFGTGALIN